MKCDNCNYETDNKKSWSNHIRYGGCNNKVKYADLKCKYCKSFLPKRKPSEQGLFCDRSCYVNWIRENNSFSGINAHRYKTGESRTRMYRTWLGIKRRCYNPNCKDYKNYGGRGIIMCYEWNDFMVFKNFCMNNGYSDDLTIERIDVNGNYCPENCTFIQNSEQSKNRRNARK